jgi:CubicO group peptidase (beta-lactamase class C family)
MIYETSPNERVFVLAQAFRKANAWTVFLLDASEATLEKRGAQVRLVIDSLYPAGYTRESFRGKVAHELDGARVQALKDFVTTAQAEAGVPGVAISLFTTDKVLFEGGLGVRELGKPAKVDADTLFIIASNTKGMSTLLLAKLVDEGKFTWDTKVTSVYPSFKLGDADTTSQVLMKHLVCACTGLPRQDLEWLFEFKDSSPKGMMSLLGTMQPTSRFGEVYQYSNVLASAAGFIGGAVLYPKLELGAAYDEAMRARVFGPLGMTETTFDFAKAQRGDHASPHSEAFGSGEPAVAGMAINGAIVPVRPAGGAWSSVKDVRHYVQMEMAKGKLPNGSRYISEAALLERRAPKIPTGEDETYGMGLEVNTEYGVPYVHHGGSMIGYKSDLFWLPDQGIGGVILTNADSGGILLKAFVRRVFELVFDGNPEAVEDVASQAKQRKERIAKDHARHKVPAEPGVVAGTAKRYANAALGDVVVTTDARGTVFDFGEWKSVVASRKNDDGTTSLLTIDPGVEGFEFVVTNKDGKRGLMLRDAQHEYAFVEKP